MRVGLTGGLASGKSTVAGMFSEWGVHTISADEIGRELMTPGTSVYREIVEKFGPEVLRTDETLDRKALASLAFDRHRLEELNAIVHPAVIAAQEEWMKGIFTHEACAIAMVESALIFEVAKTAANTGLKQRFDRIIVVALPEEQKIARYMARVSPAHWDEAVAADARRRMAAQIPDEEKISHCDYVIQSAGTRQQTAEQVKAIVEDLQKAIRLSGTATTTRPTPLPAESR